MVFSKNYIQWIGADPKDEWYEGGIFQEWATVNDGSYEGWVFREVIFQVKRTGNNFYKDLFAMKTIEVF